MESPHPQHTHFHNNDYTDRNNYSHSIHWEKHNSPSPITISAISQRF